jgi:type II secretory pathway pseudopilin PulG
MRQRQGAFTLVELVVFIAIVGVVAVALVRVFGGTLGGVQRSKELAQIVQLAQQRMEVIAGQRTNLGFAAFNAANYDPCALAIAPWPATAACTTTTYGVGSFTVTSTFTVLNAQSREVTVTVTSPQGGGPITLTRQFWGP